MRPTFRFLAAAAVFLTVAAGASAQLSLNASFNFDSQASGSLASLFQIPQSGFHNAKFAPTLDGFGDPIPGTEHWQIDAASDAAFPLLVQNPNLFGRGSAPSPVNALNGLDQEILVQFDRAYDLSAFSFTLDNDTFGVPFAAVNFISGSSVILSVGLDQTIPGFGFSSGPVAGVTGVVLPAGAFYDNLSVTGAAAVPEPATWTALTGAVVLSVAVWRRRRVAAA